jgi:hypothetical protein
MPLSDSSQTCTRAVWPKPSPADLRLGSPAGVSAVSRFSCMKFLGVPGVFDYARLSENSRYRSHSCCLPLLQERRRLECIFSELNTQPTYSPVYASSCTSRCPTQNSGPSGSLVLSREASSASASCRFSPAHCNRDFARTILLKAPPTPRLSLTCHFHP